MAEPSTHGRPAGDPAAGVPNSDRSVRPAPNELHRRHPTVSLRQLGGLAGLTIICFLLLTAIWVGLGLLVTGPLATTWVGSTDHDLANWFVAHRTPTLDLWTHIGTLLGQTIVKVTVTALVTVSLLVAWRSWREPILICLTVLLESTVFIASTWVVGRPRPDVAALDGVTVNSSFPSGHTAAAAVYGAIAVAIVERVHTLWIRAVAIVVALATPIIIGASRMYRGVHYLTDVLAGMALAVACVLLAYAIVRRVFDRDRVQIGRQRR